MYQCDWCQFYADQQTGRGWDIYRGRPQQRGYNIFSTFFRRFGMPLLKYLGKSALETGREWVKDVVIENQPPKQALKRRLVKAARNAAMEGFDHLEKKVQSGSGRLSNQITPLRKSIPYSGPDSDVLGISKRRRKPTTKKNKKRKVKPKAGRLKKKKVIKKKKPRKVTKKKTSKRKPASKKKATKTRPKKSNRRPNSLFPQDIFY